MTRTDISSVFRKEYRRLFLIAVAITADRSLAEDCIQEAVVSVMRSRTRPLNLSAYVARTVRNEALRQARRSGRVLSAQGPWLTPVDPGLPPDDLQAARELCALLAGLEPEAREAIVLHLNAGMTFREIARHSGESINTVASRYRRALKKLQKQVNQNEQSGKQASAIQSR